MTILTDPASGTTATIDDSADAALIAQKQQALADLQARETELDHQLAEQERILTALNKYKQQITAAEDAKMVAQLEAEIDAL